MFTPHVWIIKFRKVGAFFTPAWFASTLNSETDFSYLKENDWSTFCILSLLLRIFLQDSQFKIYIFTILIYWKVSNLISRYKLTCVLFGYHLLKKYTESYKNQHKNNTAPKYVNNEYCGTSRVHQYTSFTNEIISVLPLGPVQKEKKIWILRIKIKIGYT